MKAKIKKSEVQMFLNGFILHSRFRRGSANLPENPNSSLRFVQPEHNKSWYVGAYQPVAEASRK